MSREGQGSIRELSLAPVKGMKLVHPESVMLGPYGVEGDRRFHVCDASTMVSVAAKDPRLGRIEAAWDPQENVLGLRFPSGRVTESVVRLDRTVGVTRPWDDATLPARVVLGPWSEALSEELGADLLLLRAETLGGANDVAPLTLVSEASLARLARELGDEFIDAERFRMTMIATGLEEHEEDRWYGRLVRVGKAQIRILGPVPRCAVVTRRPGSGRRDHDTLRTLIRYRGSIHSPYKGEEVEAPFGVYAETVRPGRVRVGDLLYRRCPARAR